MIKMKKINRGKISKLINTKQINKKVKQNI